jgi:hypothetical protein
MWNDMRPVARDAELLLTELSGLVQAGPQIQIVHRFHRPETECQAGEEILAAYLIIRGRQMHLPLSLAVRLLLDYLARTRHIPQSGSHIAAGMRASRFYRRHGMNSGEISHRKISRSAIKEYAKRIRKALDVAFREKAGLPLDSKRILVSKETVGNETHYQLRARVEWLHIDMESDTDASSRLARKTR